MILSGLLQFYSRVWSCTTLFDLRSLMKCCCVLSKKIRDQFMCVKRSNVLSYKLGLSWGSTRLGQLLRANQQSPILDNLFNILFVLSGRYRTAMVTRHRSPSRNGTCPVPRLLSKYYEDQIQQDCI